MNAKADHFIAQARERFALDDYYGAIHLLEEVLGNGHAFADVHHLLGLSRSFLGQHERAVSHYDRALEINPGYFEALIHRGMALIELGRDEEAQESFRRAANQNIDSPSGLPGHVAAALANEHARLGEAYVEAGAMRGAVEQYRRAVELGPNFPDLRYRLARLLLECGEALAAREELERVVRDRPQFIDALASLGLARYLSGDAAGAHGVWTACLAQRPKDARVAAYLAMLERAAG